MLFEKINFWKFSTLLQKCVYLVLKLPRYYGIAWYNLVWRDSIFINVLRGVSYHGMSVGNGLPIWKFPWQFHSFHSNFLACYWGCPMGKLLSPTPPTIPLPHQSHHSTHSITNNKQRVKEGSFTKSSFGFTWVNTGNITYKCHHPQDECLKCTYFKNLSLMFFVMFVFDILNQCPWFKW